MGTRRIRLNLPVVLDNQQFFSSIDPAKYSEPYTRIIRFPLDLEIMASIADNRLFDGAASKPKDSATLAAFSGDAVLSCFGIATV